MGSLLLFLGEGGVPVELSSDATVLDLIAAARKAVSWRCGVHFEGKALRDYEAALADVGLSQEVKVDLAPLSDAEEREEDKWLTKRLIKAVEEVDESAVKDALALGAKATARKTTREGRHGPDRSLTILEVAVRLGHLGVIKLLCDSGADVNEPSQDGRHHTSPLDGAIHRGALDIVKLFCERGASVDLVYMGVAPLHMVVMRNLNIQYIPDAEEVRYQMMEVLSEGPSAFTGRTKGDLDVRCEYGNTPLHYAAENKLIPIVQLLVDKGASTDLQNHNGETPLHKVIKTVAEKYTTSAEEWGKAIRVVRVLCEKGKSADVADADGKTPADFARKLLPVPKVAKYGAEILSVLTGEDSKSPRLDAPTGGVKRKRDQQ